MFIVNCLLKNKFNINVIYYLYISVNTISQFSSLIMIDDIVLQFPELKSCCVSEPKECACVITNSSAKQYD